MADQLSTYQFAYFVINKPNFEVALSVQEQNPAYQFSILHSQFLILLYFPGMPARSHFDAPCGKKLLYIIGPAFGAGNLDRIHLLYAQKLVK